MLIFYSLKKLRLQLIQRWQEFQWLLMQNNQSIYNRLLLNILQLISQKYGRNF